MKVMCKKHNKTFIELKYTSVYWSGDSLPTCPICGTDLYDKNYNDNHEMLND